MRFLNYYDKLAGNDVRKVEQDIIWWAKKNQNGIMLIDEKTLNSLRSKLEAQTKKPQSSILELHMDKISISWINIGGEKAILDSVYANNNGEILYKQPRTWKESEVWYHFK